jgi:hypothetical protein
VSEVREELKEKLLELVWTSILLYSLDSPSVPLYSAVSTLVPLYSLVSTSAFHRVFY